MTDAEQQVRAAGKLLGIDVIPASDRNESLYFSVWLFSGPPWHLLTAQPSWEAALEKLQSLPGRDHG